LQVPVLIATAPDDVGLRVDRLGSLEELALLLESESVSARIAPVSISTERLDPWSACRRDLRSTGPDRLFWSTGNGSAIRTAHWLLTLDRSGSASLFVKPDDRFEMNDVAGRLSHEVEWLSAALRGVGSRSLSGLARLHLPLAPASRRRLGWQVPGWLSRSRSRAHDGSHSVIDQPLSLPPKGTPWRSTKVAASAKVASGRPIVGGGAGTGISAKMSEAGGIDLLVIYNSGRFRMAGAARSRE
jgi:hypothetical protein